jgi:hypothetical protein
MIVDFTLDDLARKRITQYAANLSRIPMNQIDFINQADPVEDELRIAGYEMALEEIREWMFSGRLKIFQRTMADRKGGRMLPCRIEFIRSAMAAIRSKCPDKKIVLGLDALNNVIVDPAITDEYVTAKLIADQLEEILTEFEVLFVGTGHLRKNDGRRPGLDDLKGNNFLAYDLKVAIGIYNDVKVHRDAAAVYWRDAEDLEEIRRPIIEGHVLKSKVSDFNDVICFHQWPGRWASQKGLPALALGAGALGGPAWGVRLRARGYGCSPSSRHVCESAAPTFPSCSQRTQSAPVEGQITPLNIIIYWQMI